MSFPSIHGQDAALALLHKAFARNRLGHAYLFTGPSGVGKKRAALALAQTLFCEKNSSDACGRCSACTMVLAGTHPDLIQIAPVPGKRDLVLDQVRELQRLLGLRPVHSGKKIALLDDAHLLNAAAQSGLLKLLEEPPGDALVILLTVNSATLSRPLLSRCQQVRFSALPVAVVETLLIREHGKEAAVARLLACASRGSMGRALALDPDAFADARRRVEQELSHLRHASFATISHFAEWLVADRSKKSSTATREPAEEQLAGDRLEIVLAWYEDVLRYLLLGQDGVTSYQDCFPAVAQAAAGLPVSRALEQVTLVYDTIRALARNANRQLTVEDMLLQLAR